ncbi:MAG: LysR family transcriptional regulator [Francisellaceae bacterium]
MSQRLNFASIKAFDSLMKTRNLGRTAEELYMTQSALSNTLARLRRIFDDQLFVRKGNTLKITHKAKELAPKLARILHDLNSLEQMQNEFNPRVLPVHYKIAMTGLAEHLILPPLLKKLLSYQVTLDLSRCRYFYPPYETMYPEVDLMIGIAAPAEQLHNQKLFADAIVAAGRKGNPFLTAKELSLDDYIKAKHVIIHGVPAEHNPILNKIGSPDPRTIVIRMDEYSDFIPIIEDSDVIITTTQRVADIYQKRYEKALAVSKLPFMDERYEFYMSWSGLVDQDPKNIWLRERLLEVLSESIK